MVATRKLDTWDMRLVRGFEMPGVPEETRTLLVTALGALGCEAEFGLSLLQTPLARPQPTRAEGEQWLRQCYLLGQRLVRASAEAQVAIQSYLGMLAAAELDRSSPATAAVVRPEMSDAWGARFDATPGVWWPVQGAPSPSIASRSSSGCGAQDSAIVISSR